MGSTGSLDFGGVMSGVGGGVNGNSLNNKNNGGGGNGGNNGGWLLTGRLEVSGLDIGTDVGDLLRLFSHYGEVHKISFALVPRSADASLLVRRVCA